MPVFQNLFLTLLESGSVNLVSIDPGSRFTGYCMIKCSIIDKKLNKRIIKYGCFESKHSLLHDRCISINKQFVRVVKDDDIDVIIFEQPSRAVYGDKKIKTSSYIAGRSARLHYLYAVNYFLLSTVIRMNERIKFSFVEPGKWQDKKAARKSGGSKKWSMSVATKILDKIIDNDNTADAICLGLISVDKILKSEINLYSVNL